MLSFNFRRQADSVDVADDFVVPIERFAHLLCCIGPFVPAQAWQPSTTTNTTTTTTTTKTSITPTAKATIDDVSVASDIDAATAAVAAMLENNRPSNDVCAGIDIETQFVCVCVFVCIFHIFFCSAACVALCAPIDRCTVV